MGKITLDENSPEYAIINSLKLKLERIEFMANRSAAGSSPRSKERALAVGILEVIHPEIPPAINGAAVTP